MLKIENLHVYYDGVHALKGISLGVPEGTIVTLIGANGAGKSTTLRTICGVVRPRSGTVTFQSEDIGQKEPRDIVRSGVAMVPEGRRVFPALTVRENLMMGAWVRSDSAEIERDLERVFRLFPVLQERLTQKGVTLSGGEQQMLAISRALMSRPRLLLMDEPSLGLAPQLVAQLFRTVEEVHQDGMTILLVEQNARAAFRIADYGYVLETGRIVLEGTADELASDKRVQQAYLGV